MINEEEERLQERIEELQGLSDTELATRRERFAPQLNSETVDLVAYHAAQQEQGSQSLVGKMKSAYDQITKNTPAHQALKAIDALKTTFAAYEAKVNDFEKRVDSQSRDLRLAGSSHAKLQNYTEVVIAQHSRKQRRVDSLEAQLEEHQDAVSEDSQRLRDRLIEARGELRTLKYEADGAVRQYRSSLGELKNLEVALDRDSAMLNDLRLQQNHVGAKLDECQQAAKYHFDPAGERIVVDYQNAAILAQIMQEKVKKVMNGSTFPTLDKTYAAPLSNVDNDPLVKQWDKQRK